MLYPIQTRVKSNNNEIKQSKDNGFIQLSNLVQATIKLNSNHNKTHKQPTNINNGLSYSTEQRD